MHTSHFRHRIIEFWAVGVTFFSLINFMPGVHAIPYGSGSYSGSCSYGCSASQVSPSTTTGSSTTTDTSTTPSTSITPTKSSNNTSTSDSLIASITEPSKPIDLDPYSSFASGAGQTVNIMKDSVLSFSIVVPNDSSKASTQGTKTENHTITINDVTSDSVLITIASTPQQYTLKAHESILVDVNGDSKKDLGIEVTSITPPTAGFRIWRIIPIIPLATSSQIQKSMETRNLLRVLSVILGSIIIMLMLPESFFRWLLSRFRKGDHHHHGKPGGSGSIWSGPYAPEPIHIKHSVSTQAPGNSASLTPLAINIVDFDESTNPIGEGSKDSFQVSSSNANTASSESID